MTIKIPKIFFSSAGGMTVTSPTPTSNTPTTASQKYTYYRQQQQQQYHQSEQQCQLQKKQQHQQQRKLQLQQQQRQQKQRQLYCNLYMNDEDDNMSVYSTTTSIMTTRDHPLNNSQRPLLPAKKSTAQILPKQKQHPRQQQQHQYYKHYETYYYQQQQQQYEQQEEQQQHLDHHSQYISPFVQQQKRDTAKGLHGFNDFDILSQQYNQHLQSPHIGYPYGSPPSPTATVSDFVFDAKPDTPIVSKSNIFTVHLPSQTQQKQRQYHRNQHESITTSRVLYDKMPPAVLTYSHEQLSDSSSPTNDRCCFIGKVSRFEDDFCSRRNVEFSKTSSQQAFAATAAAAAVTTIASSSSSSSRSSVSSGPFIFGVPHEQQRQLQRTRPPVNRVLVGEHDLSVDCLVETLPSSDSGVSVAGDNGPSLTHLSTDTSSSSNDTNSNSNNNNNSTNSSNNSKGIAAKLLLRKNKWKRKKLSQEQKTSSVKRTNSETATEETTKQRAIKCVVVGDGAVGKTNLILSYLENRYIPEHIPTASDIYNADVMVNDSPVHLTLCDTAGQDTLDPLRELCYPDSDVFLLCFSVAKPETFHSIKTKWAPKFTGTKAALILVGTQADLRTNTEVLNKLKTTGEKSISYADAWDLATTIGAKYIETSSATQEKVKDVFDTAIWEALRPISLPPTPPLWKKLLCLA